MQHGGKQERFGERAKFLPVAFLCTTISLLYVLFMVYHIIPMLQDAVPEMHRDDDKRSRGFIQLIFFHIVTVLLVICYIRSILEHPGTIPDNDPAWEYRSDGRGVDHVGGLDLKEQKKSGERRHCKWCGKYKPDRCHHCRVCRTCILKMDHHCPWIYNCVGFQNYKYFFLVLLYSVIDLHLIAWSMSESVIRSWDVNTSFVTMFFVLFGETLSIFLGGLITSFFLFHVWLMLQSMTTIEFCEKKMPKKESKTHDDADGTSVYDLGPIRNVQTVLGNNPLFWFLPMNPPEGDGLHYVTSQTPLMKDMEGGRGIRRISHQKQNRLPRPYPGGLKAAGSGGSL